MKLQDNENVLEVIQNKQNIALKMMENSKIGMVNLLKIRRVIMNIMMYQEEEPLKLFQIKHQLNWRMEC